MNMISAPCVNYICGLLNPVMEKAANKITAVDEIIVNKIYYIRK